MEEFSNDNSFSLRCNISKSKYRVKRSMSGMTSFDPNSAGYNTEKRMKQDTSSPIFFASNGGVTYTKMESSQLDRQTPSNNINSNNDVEMLPYNNSQEHQKK